MRGGETGLARRSHSRHTPPLPQLERIYEKLSNEMRNLQGQLASYYYYY